MGTSLTPDFWLSFLSATEPHKAPLGPQEASETAEHRGTPSQGDNLPLPAAFPSLFAQGTICVPGKDGRSPKRRGSGGWQRFPPVPRASPCAEEPMEVLAGPGKGSSPALTLQEWISAERFAVVVVLIEKLFRNSLNFAPCTEELCFGPGSLRGSRRVCVKKGLLLRGSNEE